MTPAVALLIQESRVEQLFEIMSSLLGSRQSLPTYHALPLDAKSGIIEFCKDTVSLRSPYRTEYARRSACSDGARGELPVRSRAVGHSPKWVGLRYRRVPADSEGFHSVPFRLTRYLLDPDSSTKGVLVMEHTASDALLKFRQSNEDSGTAVRKRVIRIMRRICEKYPSFENTADMLSKLVRRVVDEDGVKKLVQDTFAVLWLQSCPPGDARGLLEKKVTQMTSVARMCATEQTTDFLEQLLQALLKIGDKTVLIASRQIVDTLVDTLLTIERIMAADAFLTAI